jgi:hypothetical protein
MYIKYVKNEATKNVKFLAFMEYKFTMRETFELFRPLHIRVPE